MTEGSQFTIPDAIAAVFEIFEGAGYFDETTVELRLTAAAKTIVNPTDPEMKTINAEVSAFQYYPTDNGELSCWKTYFAPSMSHGGTHFPGIDWLDPDIIGYWLSRATHSSHPILRARYADLVWDFSRQAGVSKPPIEAARMAADAYLASATQREGEHAERVFNRLRRGLQIALSIRDQVRAINIRDAVFELLARTNEVDLWLEAHRVFMDESKFDKVKPSEEQLQSIIAAFEVYIDSVSTTRRNIIPDETFDIADRLVRHYSSLDRQADIKRVVLTAGQAVERMAAQPMRAMRRLYLFTETCKFYRSHGFSADGDRIQFLARGVGEQTESEMHEVTIKFEVPMDLTEARNNELSEGGLEAAINNIVEFFLPDMERLRAAPSGISISPLASGFTIDEGHLTGKLGPAAEEPEGALHAAIDRFVVFSMFDLQLALDHAWKRYSATSADIVAYLYKSPVFLPKFHSIIRSGIESHFVGDYPKAIHLLVPQIENSLRAILPLLGVLPDKARRGDATILLEKSLNDILEHEDKVKAFFSQFSPEAHLYLLSFLADPRGRNLRNRMFHGLMSLEEFNRNVSDRVLHILLLLGRVRAAPPETANGPESE